MLGAILVLLLIVGNYAEGLREGYINAGSRRIGIRESFKYALKKNKLITVLAVLVAAYAVITGQFWFHVYIK